MRIEKMVKFVNQKLSNADYEFQDLELYFEQAVATLNEKLGADLPTIAQYQFDENSNFDIEYDAIPDSWILSIIIPLAVAGKLQDDGINFTDYLKQATDAMQGITHYYDVPVGATKVERSRGETYTIWVDGVVHIVGRWNPEGNTMELPNMAGSQGWGFGSGAYNSRPTNPEFISKGSIDGAE